MLGRLLTALAIIGLIGLCYGTFSSQLQGLASTSCVELQERFLAFGIWAPVLMFLGFLASAVAIIPGTILTMFSGLSFGLFWGTVLALFGICSGATLAFLLTRTIGRRPIEKIVQNRPWFIKLRKQFDHKGLEFMIILRLVPMFPFTGLNFACGLMPVRAVDFILGSLIGMLPGTFVYVYLGRTGCQLMELIVQKNVRLADIPIELRWNLGLAVVLLGCLSLVPMLWRYWVRKKSVNAP